MQPEEILSGGEDFYDIFTKKETKEQARKVIALIFTSKTWINRRVDSISFPDGRTLHRRVSVDLTVPNLLPQIRLKSGTELTLLPIAFLSKEALINFSFWEGNGHKLFKINHQLGRAMMKAMLMEWAEMLGPTDCRAQSDLVLRQDYPHNLTDKGDAGQLSYRAIKRLAKQGESTDQIQSKLGGPWSFEQIQDEFLRKPDHWGYQRGDSRGEALLVLARLLSREYVLFLSFEKQPRPGRRLLVKYEYDTPLTLYDVDIQHQDHITHSGWKTAAWILRRFCGNERVDLTIPAFNTSYSRTYHFELTTPEGVGITGGRLYDEDERHSQGVPPKALNPDTGGGNATRFGLYPLQDIPWATRGRAFVRINLTRGLWMWATAAMAFIIAAPLVVVTIRHQVDPRWKFDQLTSSNALGWAVAAFLGAILPVTLIREENDFARKMELSTRLVGFLIGVVPIAYVLAFSSTWARWLVAVLSVLLAIRQALQLHFSTSVIKSSDSLTEPTAVAETRPSRQDRWLGRRIRFASEAAASKFEFVYEHEYLKKDSVKKRIREAVAAGVPGAAIQTSVAAAEHLEATFSTWSSVPGATVLGGGRFIMDRFNGAEEE